MKRLAAVIGILAAIYFLPTIGMDIASSSRGVVSVPPPSDSWIAGKLAGWNDVHAYRIVIDPMRFPDLDSVVAGARPLGKLIEKGPKAVVYQTTASGIDRAIEFRLTALDDPEKLENTLTVVEAIRCTGRVPCWKRSLMSSFDNARGAYRLSTLAGIRKTPGAG